MRTIATVTAVAAIFLATTGMSRVPEGSEAFQEGWLEGCKEGYVAGGWKGYDYFIDQDRLASDPDYRAGREAGLAACYKEASERPRDIGPGGR